VRYYWLEFTWWARSRKEKLAIWFVGKLPKWLIYRASLRCIAHATTGKFSGQVVPDLTAMEVLQRWPLK
jgi:hypothetical protein